MRSIRHRVEMPIGSELPGVLGYGNKWGVLKRAGSWAHPLLYAMKLGFFVLFVLPPAGMFWIAYIAAKGDVNYLLTEVSTVLQNTSESELMGVVSNAYCVIALFGLLFIGLYMLLIPYTRSRSYIVGTYTDSEGNECQTRIPARGSR